MIDTLVAMRPRIDAFGAPERLGLDRLRGRDAAPAGARGRAAARGRDRRARARWREELPVVFPVHPRTAHALERAGIAAPPGVRLLDPVGYVEFLSLVAGSAAVVTDSGGIQEETTYLGVPCFTLRDNTERPVTIELGTNVLLGLRAGADRGGPGPAPRAGRRATACRPGWDGHAAERIRDVLSGWSSQ